MQFSERQYDSARQVKREQRLRAYGCRSPRLHALSPGKNVLGQFQNAACVFVGKPAQRREADPAVAAFEQGAAQLLFQTAYGGGDRGLGNSEFLRRRAEGPRVGGGDKVFQLFQSHVCPP